MVTALEKRWGDEKYKRLRSIGFDCIDYQIADTNTFIYSLPDGELRAYLKKERALADEAGIKIHQIHGPWQWPPRDLTEEDRAERMEKMKKSLYIAHLLGCRYWIVHPIMPYGIEEAGTENADKTWVLTLKGRVTVLV